MVREGRVIISGPGTRPAFGVGYYVQALEVGAQVTEASSGVTATVAAGHGLAADDKVIVGLNIQQYRIVDSVTATEVTFTESVSLAAGDFIVNLADDTGSIQPNYDGNGLTVYTDMDFQNQAITNSVLSDSEGRYRYWHKGIAIWELVRDSNGTPFAIYTDAAEPDQAKVSYGVRYAHLFADGGTGTEDDPWTLTGSNPVQSAIDDLPATGGTVHMIAGSYDLGSDTAAVTIPPLTDATDTRGYRIEGAGRDLVFLQYSGTGTAIRYEGTTQQSNQIVLRGFSLLQTGTSRTGFGFWGSYISESLFEDLNVGCRREDRQSGDDDNGWEVGINIEATTGSHVADFNRFHRLYFLGNTLGLYIDNQGDNTVVSECSFEPRQDVAEAQDGCHIHNSSGVEVSSSHFNYFNFDSDSFGLKISGTSKGTVVSANYFEDCKNMLFVYTDGDQHGTQVSGNSFSFTDSTTSYGVRVGLDGGTYKCKGISVSGNSFFNMGSGNVGVRMGSDVKGFVISGNGYDNQGGTDRTLQSGCRGFVIESFDETNYQPVLQVIDDGSSVGQILLDNQGTSANVSPRIQFSPGNSAPHGVGALNMYIGVSATGEFQIQDKAGAVVASVSQLGALAALSVTTTGNNTLGDAATDLTTNVGRMIFRTIASDPTGGGGAAGTIGEVIYSSSTAKFYGKHTTTATDTNWRLLGT